MMDVTFEYDGIHSSNRLELMILEKLNKLEAKYDFIIRARVFLKTTNTSSPQTGKICKIQLSVPGPLLFAETNAANFETALAETLNDLSRQLSKKKEKMKSH
ncbi:MAG: HPF/RaiA family ribosome-associated protein [Bacteroidota bacterium]